MNKRDISEIALAVMLFIPAVFVVVRLVLPAYHQTSDQEGGKLGYPIQSSQALGGVTAQAPGPWGWVEKGNHSEWGFCPKGHLMISEQGEGRKDRAPVCVPFVKPSTPSP